MAGSYTDIVRKIILLYGEVHRKSWHATIWPSNELDTHIEYDLVPANSAHLRVKYIGNISEKTKTDRSNLVARLRVWLGVEEFLSYYSRGFFIKVIFNH